MDDLEEFAALTITPTKEGTKKVLGSGESLNINQRIVVPDDKIEDACHMRWHAADYERLVLTRLCGHDGILPWKDFYNIMEETQTRWVTSRPRQHCFPMNAKPTVEGAKRRTATRTNTSSHWVTSVCVNEFWAFVVRKQSEDAPQLLAISSLDKIEDGNEIVWDDTEIEVNNFRVGSVYFDQLYLVDDYHLIVINAVTRSVIETRELEPLLKQYSEVAPRINAIRVSESFVVISVQSKGVLVLRRAATLPFIGFIAANVSIAAPDHQGKIAVGLQTGVTEYWGVDDEGSGMRCTSTESFFTSDTAASSKKPIIMKPQPIWNIFTQGPRVAVSSREYFVMADKNPIASRICKLEDCGTIDYFTTFGDFVVTGEHVGSILMLEYASGKVFYRSDEPKRRCKQLATIGSEHISFAYDRIVDLLPNGNVLVITTKPAGTIVDWGFGQKTTTHSSGLPLEDAFSN